MDFDNMSNEDAQKRLKELNKEIRKHELVFLLFIFLIILEILLTSIGAIPFNILTVIIFLGSVLSCYGIFKYSEPYEMEKYLIEIIFGKDKK